MYSGFWKRFAAYILDNIIIFIAIIIFILIWAGFKWVLTTMGVWQKANENIFVVFEGACCYSIPWLYFALFESSRLKGTLGKLAVNIAVVDEKGDRITFAKATGRFFSRIISALILYIGFIMIGITPKKQALHDLIAGTYVINKSYRSTGSVEGETLKSM